MADLTKWAVVAVVGTQRVRWENDSQEAAFERAKEIRANGYRRTLSRGLVVLIPPHRIHRIEVRPPRRGAARGLSAGGAA